MFDQIDESDLLGLIEGDLAAEKADALWQSLQSEPHVYQVVKAMCEDRKLLRSLNEPILPMGILESLEPQLARPMLMAPTNADLRYKGRQTKRRYLAPIAAGIGLVLVTSVWAAFSGLFTSSNDLPVDTVASTIGDSSAAESDDTWQTQTHNNLANEESAPLAVPAGSTIHHYGPVDLAATESVGEPATANNTSAQIVAADFALALTLDDETDIETILQTILKDLPTQTALVRNFSFAEARRLADDWVLASAKRRNVTEPDIRTASIGGPSDSQIRSKVAREFNALAFRAKNQLKTKAKKPIDPKSVSKQLSGPKRLAPSFEQQLTFSMHGATYTIAIPASRLNEILAKLQSDPARSTTLKMLTLDKNRESEAPKINLPRLTDYTLARKEADRLTNSGTDTIILLPIIVN